MIVYDHINYSDFTELYQAILSELINEPQFKIAPRGMNIHEFVNVTVITPADKHVLDFTSTGAPERQEAYDRYRKAELDWYLSGNTLASSAPSKFWNQLAQADGHITSNYGHMMLFDKVYPAAQNPGDSPVLQSQAQTPFERVVETLLKDPDSRQAIVNYNQPKHCWPGNKDFPCTLSSQLFLRNGELHITTHQRSCDIIKGFSYDVPWSCHFLEMVVKALNEKGLNVVAGEVSMVFGSLHLYEKDIDLAKRIVTTV